MPELRSQTVFVRQEKATKPKMALQAAEVLQSQCDPNDQKILNATIKAFQSGTLTPLIKEELRCTIQSRRLAEGKGELKVEFKSPPKRKEMDDEERARYLKRRVQNREAAQRFRQRQKDTSDTLLNKIKRLERSSKVLLSDVSKLREEKETLREMLRNHLMVCTNQHNVNSLLSQEKLDQLLADPRVPDTTSSETHSDTTSTPGCWSPRSSVSTTCLSATTPPRPGTADSSATGSDVFFPSEEDDEYMNMYGIDPANTEVEVIVTTGTGKATSTSGEDNVPGQLETFEFEPVVQDVCYEEEVVIDSSNDLVDDHFNQQTYYTNDISMRLDSCSSVDTELDSRGLASSAGFMCPNLHTSQHTDSIIPESSHCFNNPHLTPVYDNQRNIVYLNTINTPAANTDKYTQEIANDDVNLVLAQSLVSELEQSDVSDFDLSAIASGNLNAVTTIHSGIPTEAAAGLAESTSDLRQSLTFAYSRMHDICDVDLDYSFNDLLFKGDTVS